MDGGTGEPACYAALMVEPADTPPPEEAPKSIPGRHDRVYRLLFSYPQMVEDALTGFIAEPWVGELDFSTLEKMAEIHVSERLDLRFQDVVWKVRWRSRSSAIMAVRSGGRRATWPGCSASHRVWSGWCPGCPTC